MTTGGMTMSEALALGLSGVTGGLLGAFFFGGLWWTVRKAVSSRQPALWFLGSVLLRVGVVVAGFLVASGSHWELMLACLLGFVLSRPVVTRLTRPAESGPALHRRAGSPPTFAPSARSRSEASDAPHS